MRWVFRTIVCYDIPKDRRRTRVMKTMEAFGHRVQYSVFECDLTVRQLASLRRRLLKIIDRKVDNVRIYRLCEADASKIISLGVDTSPGRDPLIVV